MTLTIGITGANGYVGSRLGAALADAGHEVVGFVRRPGPGERAFTLGDTVDPELLADIDVLIHCAWDMRANTAKSVRRINIAGSAWLLDAARQAGVPRCVFISSMSAWPGCHSLYGQAKLEVEQRVQQLGGISVRPGLIYGARPGGMVGALLGLAQRLPVLPMVGTGRFTLHTCHEDDLAELLLVICMADNRRLAPVITAAADEGLAFRDIVTRLAGRPLTFVPVPWRLAWLGIKTLESLGMRPRMKSDSLIGLVYSDPQPDFTTLHALGATFRTLEPPPAGA